MNVLLIMPPGKMYFTYNPMVNPLGILYLAAILDRNGRHRVKVLDCLAKRISVKKLVSSLKSDPPDVVGISFTTDARFYAFHTARALREALPSLVIVGGGPHATITAEDTLQHIEAFDILVRGEGEITFVDLLDALEDKRPLETVAGISFRRDNKIFHNQERPAISNLDDIIFPAWERIDLHDYDTSNRVPGRPNLLTASVISSRGCPAKCSFCANALLWGTRVRTRSSTNFVDEIQLLHDKFGVRYLRISDDTFNVKPDMVLEICDEILSRGLDLHWECGIRVDKVSLEMLKAMKLAGCMQAVYGVESVNKKTLKGLIGKNITLEQVEQVSAWCREIGLYFIGGYIISFPDETMEDMRRTLAFMKHIGGRSGVNILRIYPGTKIEEIARERGVLPHDFSWAEEKFTIKNALPGLAGPIPLYIEDIPWAELQKALFDWAKDNRIGLLKPFFMTLRSIRSFNDFSRLVQFGTTYIKQWFTSKFNSLRSNKNN